ncbi:MAG: HAMP domain-containing protein, partial [Desulfovibrio sp.]|nr:HAMP domain-containing protein [Desulfovibrio sp.]
MKNSAAPITSTIRKPPFFLSLGVRLASVCALLVLLTAACLMWFAHKGTIVSLRNTQRRTLDNVLYLLEHELIAAHGEALRAKVEAVEEIKASLIRSCVAAADASGFGPERSGVIQFPDPGMEINFYRFNSPFSLPQSIVDGSLLPESLLPVAAALQPGREGDFGLQSDAGRGGELSWLMRKEDMLLVCTRSLQEAEEAGQKRMRRVAERFSSLLGEVHVQQSGFAAVADNTGNIVLGPPWAHIPEKLRSTLAAGVFAGASRRVMVLPEEDGSSGEILYLLAYFRPLDWNIVLAAPLNELEAPAIQLVAGQLWISLLVMVVGTILGLLFALRISAPVRRLAHFARELPAQDILTMEAETMAKALPLRRQDEVGELARSFRYMTEELRDNVRKLVDSTARRERM